MRTVRIVTLVIVVGLIAALATACGGGDDSAATPSTAAGTTTPGAPTTTAPSATTSTAPATTASTAPGTATTVTGGTTTLTIDGTVSDVIDAAGIDLAAAAPAEAQGDTVRFPVTGGTVATAPLSGTLDHAGALKLSALGRDVELARPRVDLTAGTLSGEIRGRRVPVFDLRTEGADVTEAGGATRIRGIGVSVGAQGAQAIGDALGVSVLRGGLDIGTLAVSAEG